MGPVVYDSTPTIRDASPSPLHMGLHLDLDLTMINGHLRRDLSQHFEVLDDLRAETRAAKESQWRPYVDESMGDYTMGDHMEVHLPDLMEITSPVRKRKRTLESSEEDAFAMANRKARKIATLRQSISYPYKQPLQITSPNTPPSKASFLRPCRICHSSPKSKKHVAGFLSCARCGGWTCTVCQRYCETDSCRYRDSATCSDCCVEDGANWELHCRDCAYGIA